MSSKDKPIRIIKRTERTSLSDPETPAVSWKTERQTKREMLQTIKLWIEEQRESKKVLTQGTVF